MKLSTRLVLTIGGIALLLVFPALYAASQLTHLKEIASRSRQMHGAAFLAMGQLQAHLSELDRVARSHVVAPDLYTLDQRQTAVNNARRQLANLSVASYGDVASDVGRVLDRIERELHAIDTLLAAGHSAAATLALEGVKALIAQGSTNLVGIADMIEERSYADLADAQRISTAALTTTILSLIACMVIALALGAWSTREVIRPIHRLKRAMASVAGGDFAVPASLPNDRTDEIGDLAESFRAMAQHLADLDRMKAEFMSIATHELKTPINVIGGYAELLQEGVYGRVREQEEVALTSIREQARILTQLVNQLLDVSRLEAGGLQLDIQEVDVADLFEQLRRTFQVLARKQGVSLTVELKEATVPARVPGDIDRLRDQVLGNLLSNALKFTPRGGDITLRGWGESNGLHMEVIDTGTGIPADQLPFVFDKYFQVGEQARSKGAGLGLTIAHDVIEAHGGTIAAESEEGRGSRFLVILPATLDQQADAHRRRSLALVGEEE